MIEPVYRVRCSGPCRRWLSIPESYGPGEDIPHAALEPQPTAARAGMWPDETAAQYAAVGAGWSSGTCPDCRAREDGEPASTSGPSLLPPVIREAMRRHDDEYDAIMATFGQVPAALPDGTVPMPAIDREQDEAQQPAHVDDRREAAYAAAYSCNTTHRTIHPDYAGCCVRAAVTAALTPTGETPCS